MRFDLADIAAQIRQMGADDYRAGVKNMNKQMSDSITKQVNSLLIGAMSERGMSRSDMSRALDVTRETISIALNDVNRDWKICTLAEWADALNCDLVIQLQRRQDEPDVTASWP